jgi:hypothetical protein
MRYIVNGRPVTLSDDRPPPRGAIKFTVEDDELFARYAHLYKVSGRRVVPPTKAEIAEYEGTVFTPDEVRALKELARRHLAKKE